MLAFIIWKLEWMKILFELTLNIESIIALLEYNCFDYCFQVLFMNVTFEYYCECQRFLLLWIILWILPVLKYYDGQVLNEKLKLIGTVMKFFSKKLLGHETFTSGPLGYKIFFGKTLRLPSPPPAYLYNVHSLKKDFSYYSFLQFIIKTITSNLQY